MHFQFGLVFLNCQTLSRHPREDGGPEIGSELPGFPLLESERPRSRRPTRE